jgi:coenzyme F420-reducing hydrogenase delta subunit/ferredoxin
MCTGRVDLAFVLRAFRKGADGVFVAGCHLNECNYITHGNYYALGVGSLCKRLLEHVGVEPDRLRIELVSGGEANRFVEIVNQFSERIRGLGPVGGGADEPPRSELMAGLDRLTDLVPYIKLQTREKLRSRLPTREDYDGLFTRDEVERLLGSVASYYIAPDRCQACMTCAKRCPVAAIEGGKGRIHVIDQDKCIKCGRCFEVCPPRFAAVTRLSGEPVPPPLPESERVIDRKKK